MGLEGEPSACIFALYHLELLHHRAAFMSLDTVAAEFLLGTSVFPLIGHQLDK